MLRISRAVRRFAPLICLALAAAVPAATRVPASRAPAAQPTPQPSPAQPAPAKPAESALPPLPDQSSPWLYKGSDVPHDAEWSFGTLGNGLRWAARANGVPPGQVSIRIRIDAGSLHERRGEEGFAHLIEHLVFRQSRWLGEAQAIPTWQRLGASFGTDTNAETTPTHTVFKIDLPDADPAKLDEAFKLLSGMMIAPTLSESDIRTEVPIVLAEKRERGGTAERLQDLTRSTFFAGQPMGDHATIGSVESVEGAHQDAVRAFHQRWYRPENAVIIASGDADPRLLAALIAKWFGDWPATGAHVPAPDFGAPVAPPGSPPANPVGETAVAVEPDLPRALTMAVERPWHEKNDTIVYNQGLMIDQVSLALINRRLEARARKGASYLAASVAQENSHRSVDGTFISVTPLDGNWREALHDVRAVIADALDRPPSVEEIAREAAEINVAFESTQQQRALQPGSKLADDLVQAVDIHETVASPEVVLDIFRKSIPLFTPQAVLEHSRKLFAGAVIRAVYVTPKAGEASAASLKAALASPVAPDPKARPGGAMLSFKDLPPIGKPGAAPVISDTRLLGIEQLSFDNGVKAMIWPTREDPGRVMVKVRFGAGRLGFAPGDTAYIDLGNLALVGSGEGSLGQEELDNISTGRKMGFDFRIDDASFQFSAETRNEDLADQLYLFADKFAHPRWDASPVLRARALARSQYAAMGTSPQGVFDRDFKYFLRGKDPRFATADPAQLAQATPEGFRKAWEPVLARGPIEIQIFGDFDRDKAIEALRATFGALPSRSPLAQPAGGQAVGFAASSAHPQVLYHHGEPNQAAVSVAWPTSGGIAGIHDSRALQVLAQVFSNRLMNALREKAGASYAPQVLADWPVDLQSGGNLLAVAQIQPQMVGDFFATADAIAADLAAKPPSADEMALVLEPMRQQISRATSSTAYFMWQIEGATAEPARIDAVRSILSDLAAATPERMQELAKRYLVADKAWRLAIVPEGKGGK